MSSLAIGLLYRSFWLFLCHACIYYFVDYLFISNVCKILKEVNE